MHQSISVVYLRGHKVNADVILDDLFWPVSDYSFTKKLSAFRSRPDDKWTE